MCVLCGEFVEQLHWTDMELKELDSERGSGEHQRDRKRSRLLRTEICNDILSLYGIKMMEWNNTRFVLTNNKGKTEVVQNLADIWEKAEEMIGAPVDPLDERLLSELSVEEG